MIKQERKDEVARKSIKLSKEDTIFLTDIMHSFAKRGHFDYIANDLLTNDFWSNGIDLINIFYEQEHVTYVSVYGFTDEEHGVAVSVDKFLEKMDTVKQKTIKRHPEKTQLCEELYSKLTDKLNK